MSLVNSLIVVGLACAPDDVDPAPTDRTENRVGAVGGSASSADGRLTLDFPPGALDVETLITIEPKPGAAIPGSLSPVYDLGPDGVAFAVPVAIAIADVRADRPAAIAIVDNGEPRVLPSSTWAPATATAHAELEHFSSYVAIHRSPSFDAGLASDGGLGAETDLGVTGAGDASFSGNAPDAAVDGGGPTDGGPTDGGPTDGGPTDGGPTDGGPMDGGPTDASPTDGGWGDTGLRDAGSTDSGSLDAGSPPPPYSMTTGQTPFYIQTSSGNSGYGFNSSGRVDNSATIPLPFPFEFFGTVYPAGSDLFVTSNGRVFFGSGAVDAANTTLPATSGPHGQIAAFWDALLWGSDLYVRASAYHVELIFSNVANRDASAFVTFAVVLHAGTNIIEVDFGQISPNGFSATVGLEAPTGTMAVQLPCSPNCTSADIPTGTSVRFAPPGPHAGYDLRPVAMQVSTPSTVYPGDVVTVSSVSFANDGLVTSGRRMFRIYTHGPPYDLSAYGPGQYFADYVPSAVAPGATAPHVFLPFQQATFMALGAGTLELWAVLDRDLFDLDRQNEAVRLATIPVSPRLGSCRLVATSLPIGQVGVAYSAPLAFGGCPAPSWTVSPPLPSGLVLSAGGQISGTPSGASSLSHRFTVEQRGYGSSSITLPLVIQ